MRLRSYIKSQNLGRHLRPACHPTLFISKRQGAAARWALPTPGRLLGASAPRLPRELLHRHRWRGRGGRLGRHRGRRHRALVLDRHLLREICQGTEPSCVRSLLLPLLRPLLIDQRLQLQRLEDTVVVHLTLRLHRAGALVRADAKIVAKLLEREIAIAIAVYRTPHRVDGGILAIVQSLVVRSEFRLAHFAIAVRVEQVHHDRHVVHVHGGL